jgi:hypothetical protein
VSVNVKMELKPVGFFFRWELIGYSSTLVPLAVPPVPNVPPSALEEMTSFDETRKREVYCRGCEGARVEVRSQCKSLLLENCEKCTIVLTGGCIASVELVRCRGCTIVIEGPVAAVRLDDSSGTLLHFSWLGKSGFAGIEGRGSGCGIFSTGCHSSRVSYPSSSALDAPRFEVKLPEMLLTRLEDSEAAPSTRVLDSRSPWGTSEEARPSVRPKPEEAPPVDPPQIL